MGVVTLYLPMETWLTLVRYIFIAGTPDDYGELLSVVELCSNLFGLAHHAEQVLAEYFLDVGFAVVSVE